MKIKDLLETCNSTIHTLGEEETVEQALKLMAGHSVSAVVVKGQADSPIDKAGLKRQPLQ